MTIQSRSEGSEVGKPGVALGTAYPGTPSTEVLENFARYSGIKAEWASNEKVALDNAAGASFGGARSMAVMKHVGVNVAADPLMTIHECP